MPKFPIDAQKWRVVKTLELLGFRIVREKEHISMVRNNRDGTNTPLTMPNHAKIKASTLRTICTQAGISREEFLGGCPITGIVAREVEDDPKYSRI